MALDRKTYRFSFGVNTGIVHPDDRVSFTKDREGLGRVFDGLTTADTRGIHLFAQEPVSSDTLEDMRILRAVWIRYLHFPCFLGGFVDGSDDNQRDIAYLLNVAGPFEISASPGLGIRGGYELLLQFASMSGSALQTVISGDRGSGLAGEIYIITNPGRTDSDGVVQKNADMGEPPLVVPPLPKGSTQRYGNIRVTESTFQGETERQVISQGASTILVPSYAAREFVEGITYGIDFSLPDASGRLTIQGSEYRLRDARELSNRKFAVQLTRDVSESG